MFDLVQLRLIAGDGGNGRVSFRREKYIAKGGPNGGNAGDGGSIVLKATKNHNTLQHFAGVKEFVAQSGESGGASNMEGNDGEDLIIEVPVGTRVWLTGENTISKQRRSHRSSERQLELPTRHKLFQLTVNGGRVVQQAVDEVQPIDAPLREDNPVLGQDDDAQSSSVAQKHINRSESLKNVRFQEVPKTLLVELTIDGQTYEICRGGQGGRGNDHFKSSVNTTPIEAEYGIPGERKSVLLELRLIADIGLVGYPNAGKSTLLSVVTRANPKIANYPFTTLEPNLGVMFSEEDGGRDIVMADIPGLIEGASEGKGLGFEFLRHVQATSALLYVLSLDEALIFSEESVETKAVEVWNQYQVLLNELKSYESSLVAKPAVVALSKSDLYSVELIEAIRVLFDGHGLEITPFSSVTRDGLQVLQHSLRSQIK